MPEARYRALGALFRLKIGDELELLACPLRPSGVALPASTTRMIDFCGRSSTLEEHARTIRARLELAPEHHALVLENLAVLVEAGALVPDDAIVARAISSSPPAETREVIGLVGIPTCNRGAALERCIRSVANDRELRVVVADDARAAADREQTRSRLAALARELDVSIAYAGREEKEAYAAALSRETGVSLELVREGLLNDDAARFGAGANRNILLLHGAGEPVLLLDDDTVASIAPTPSQLPGVALSAVDDPTEFWFPEGDGSPDELVSYGALDIREVHARALGRRVGSLLAEARAAGLPIDVDRASHRLLRRIGDDGCVVLTAMGVSGDSGIGSPAFLLELVGASRERLFASAASYARAFRDRQLLRAASRLTIADSGFCMGMNLGVDLRLPVAPFMPREKNEDGVFGAAVRATTHGGCFAFLPHVLRHLPEGVRTHDVDGVLAAIGGNNANDMVVTLIRSLTTDLIPGDRKLAIESLGRNLRALGSLELGDLEWVLRTQVWREKAERMERMETLLAQHGRAPSAWADHTQRFIENTRGALASPLFLLARDLVDPFGRDRAPDALRTSIRRYGELLEAWPAMHDGARWLAERGVRPGVAP
jgi:hypothetical protein